MKVTESDVLNAQTIEELNGLYDLTMLADPYHCDFYYIKSLIKSRISELESNNVETKENE